MDPTVPRPRRPLPASGPVGRWYENVLGWPTVPGPPGAGAAGAGPALLVCGVRFDVLEMPSRAADGVLRRYADGAPPGVPAAPVARSGGRTWFLMAAGCAEELPGLLEWLGWGALPEGLGLVAIGAGGRIEAPRPPGWPPHGDVTRGGGAGREGDSQGAATWMRPPEPGHAVEPTLPAPWLLPSPGAREGAPGGGGGAPDLVRLVDSAATECLRVRLGRACDQRWASSYA
ncbi:SCO3374 family protein [Streptomyces uncialis]|uniref:SCO3374 family protein n=1 Tax=Streptomyces uncialis TaxID=1048205 RepID=UPI003814EED8